RSTLAGEGRHPRRWSFVREEILGAGRGAAAATERFRADDKRALLRLSGSGECGDCRAVSSSRNERRFTEPPQDLCVPAEGHRIGRTLREENSFHSGDASL